MKRTAWLLLCVCIMLFALAGCEKTQEEVSWPIEDLTAHFDVLHPAVDSPHEGAFVYAQVVSWQQILLPAKDYDSQAQAMTPVLRPAQLVELRVGKSLFGDQFEEGQTVYLTMSGDGTHAVRGIAPAYYTGQQLIMYISPETTTRTYWLRPAEGETVKQFEEIEATTNRVECIATEVNEQAGTLKGNEYMPNLRGITTVEQVKAVIEGWMQNTDEK